MIELRTAGPDDADLLWEVYRSSRTGPLAVLPAPLLRMQHQAREKAYRESFAGADDRLIVVAGQVSGRVLVWRGPAEHRIVDIAIVASHQGRGIGTVVLKGLVEDATMAGRPLRLTVAADNDGARRLYRRLGFLETGGDELNVEMEIG